MAAGGEPSLRKWLFTSWEARFHSWPHGSLLTACPQPQLQGVSLLIARLGLLLHGRLRGGAGPFPVGEDLRLAGSCPQTLCLHSPCRHAILPHIRPAHGSWFCSGIPRDQTESRRQCLCCQRPLLLLQFLSPEGGGESARVLSRLPSSTLEPRAFSSTSPPPGNGPYVTATSSLLSEAVLCPSRPARAPHTPALCAGPRPPNPWPSAPASVVTALLSRCYWSIGGRFSVSPPALSRLPFAASRLLVIEHFWSPIAHNNGCSSESLKTHI